MLDVDMSPDRIKVGSSFRGIKKGAKPPGGIPVGGQSKPGISLEGWDVVQNDVCLAALELLQGMHAKKEPTAKRMLIVPPDLWKRLEDSVRGMLRWGGSQVNGKRFRATDDMEWREADALVKYFEAYFQLTKGDDE